MRDTAELDTLYCTELMTTESTHHHTTSCQRGPGMVRSDGALARDPRGGGGGRRRVLDAPLTGSSTDRARSQKRARFTGPATHHPAKLLQHRRGDT